ncbi:MAG: TonB-dependent receptor [Bacteroidetes bacterium]|nr:TonB-dependent receptor [Bacteroidota bacterium]
MKKGFIVCLLFWALTGLAQHTFTDSLHLLKPVEIQALRLNLPAPGAHTESIDSAMFWMHSNSSMAKLISDLSTVMVRSYGTGGLSTLSFRGTQTNQSGIFWNGFNLNQANLGMADLSEIPAFFFNDVNIQFGGSSSVLGSGIIGGSLQLGNQDFFSKPLTLTLSSSAISFHNYSLAFKASAGSSKWSFSTSFTGNSDRNDFKYRSLEDSYKRLSHAMSSGLGMLNTLSYRLNSAQTLTMAVWAQHTDKQIPATLVMNSSKQRQVDKALRTSLQWTRVSAVQQFQVRTAWFSESQHYTNGLISLDNTYRLGTWCTEGEYKRQFQHNTSISAGITYRMVKADITDYHGKRQQDEAALFASLLHIWKPEGWSSRLNVRQDLDNSYHIPFCPSFGTEGPLTGNLKLRLLISRNYRIPTMNDRFWLPGGNPDLLPESSWNEEAGIDWQPAQNDRLVNVLFRLTAYSIQMKNMILWEPFTSDIWSPVNIQEVWSRGLESSLQAKIDKSDMHLLLIVAYSYSPSTYQGSNQLTKAYEGKQLIYVPLNKANANLRASAGKYFGLINGSWSGKRYVQQDNEKALPSYTVLNLTVGREFISSLSNTRLQFEIQNLLNTKFQAVQYYPEPGISFMFNLTFTIHKNPKK